jgi:TonB-dependent receptor
MNYPLVLRVFTLARSSIAFLTVALGTAFAQSTGTISGTVSDRTTNAFLVGAEVRVAGTEIATATARDGTFTLANAPAGQQSLEVSYVGRKTKIVPVSVRTGGTTPITIDLAETDVIVLEAVTVESVREGQSRAINQQRTSNSILNVISSDAIGNLPDNTVGDALARVAGVSVVIDGSSAFASIRGAEAKLNAVTLDGQHISSPANDGVFTVSGTETRAVDLNTIPSDMISSIEVLKALPADHDADAFGGAINLVTRSAFDLPGRSINGKAEYRYNSLRKDDGYGLTLSYSDVLDTKRTLGVSATFAYTDDRLGRNDYEIAYFDKSIAPVNTIPGITDQAISEFDQRFRRIDRESFGANLNFDYRPGDTSRFFLKLFHNGSETDARRWRLRERGFNTFAANSTDLRAAGTEARITRRLDRTISSRNNERASIGGQTKLPAGKLDYELSYGFADFNAHAKRYTFETASSALRRNIDFVVDRADPDYPRVTLINRATGENSLFRTQDMALNQVRFHNLNGEDEDLVARLDYEFAQKAGNIPLTWKFGAKYRGKDRNLDGEIADYAPVVAPTQATFTGGFEPRNVFHGRKATFGPFPSIDDVFAAVAQNPNNYSFTPNDEISLVSISRYTASEDISSVYGMTTAQLGKLQAIAGVRYEETKIDYTYRPAPATTAKGGSSYGNAFPSVLLNYRFNRNLVLRGAWTNTMSRPDYGDLIPYESSLDPEGLLNLDSGALARVFKGNPNLKAQKSMNWDASLEWYFQPTGMLSVAIFHKDIRSFIYKGVTRESRPPIIVALYQNLNGGKQDIDGTELTWVQSLSMLPSPFNGFGFSVNTTFIRGESEFPTLNVTTGATGTRTENFIPQQPKRVYNAQLYWEKYGFNARVALNYTDEFVREVGGLAGQVTNYDATRIDAQLSYRINRNFTVFVEGKNLTDEKRRWYDNRPSRPEEMEDNGWNGAAGVKFRF